MEESSEAYWLRHKEAEVFTAAKLGPAPRSNQGQIAVFAFFATSLPAYFALLFAGFNGDRLQIPLISIGAISAAATYFYLNAQYSKWHNTHQQRMIETAPPTE